MKYSESVIVELDEFIDEMTDDPSVFWMHCSVHHVALLFGVHRDTIYDWRNNYPRFSDTIKRWETKRNALFLQLKKKDSAWIFIAKNWLDMRDTQHIDQKTEFKPIQVIINDNGNAPKDNPA